MEEDRVADIHLQNNNNNTQQRERSAAVSHHASLDVRGAHNHVEHFLAVLLGQVVNAVVSLRRHRNEGRGSGYKSAARSSQLIGSE